MMHEQTCLGVAKTLLRAAFMNEMSSLHEENTELSVRRVSFYETRRRREDVASMCLSTWSVCLLYGYTVCTVRVLTVGSSGISVLRVWANSVML